jgi:predicted DNA-binding transcriptional regulator AlpA
MKLKLIQRALQKRTLQAQTIKQAIMESELIQSELQEIKQLTLLGAKRALTMKDASLLTGLSISNLYKKCSLKEIPHWKSGGGKFTYFDKDELNAWMLQNRVKPAYEIEQEAANYLVNGKAGKEAKTATKKGYQGFESRRIKRTEKNS